MNFGTRIWSIQEVGRSPSYLVAVVNGARRCRGDCRWYVVIQRVRAVEVGETRALKSPATSVGPLGACLPIQAPEHRAINFNRKSRPKF
jgi:hypothetical protein